MTMSRTENGALTHASSGSAVLDLFFTVGASRGNTGKLPDLFRKAYTTHPDLAVRVALWARDVRGGAGEREAFRTLLKAMDARETFDEGILMAIATVGRADDLLVIEKNFPRMAVFYKNMIDNSELSGLFAKWAPRQGPVANNLRKAWGFSTPKAYRQYLVGHTNVIEQAMCAKDWSDINYAHVPSVAMARYNAAFSRNDTARFTEYKSALENGLAKINANAVFPHDIVRTCRNRGADIGIAQAQWDALPNFIAEGSKILPMSDVSGSMDQKISGSVTAMDVSIALGVYIAERQTGPFKDLVMTFSADPKFHELRGNNIKEKIDNLESAEWGMNTDLNKAFRKILDVAVTNNVPASDMPEILLILSDMEFDDAAARRPYDHLGNRNVTPEATNYEAARQLFDAAGYKLPKIVFWNLASRTKNVPVKAGATDVALVSGFSPSTMKAILAAEDFSPWAVMLDVINVPRYDVDGWTL